MIGTPPADKVTANVVLTLGTSRLETRVSISAGPMRVADLLPLARRVAGAIIDAAVQEARDEGREVSCQKGCGACCRQLVPISETEARQIRDLVEALPDPRRSEIKGRFAAAAARLQEAGMLDVLNDRAGWAEEGVSDLGLRYFQLGIPCPFLEDESCSIHPDRPITCREYLVTSPPANCANPSRDTVDTIRLPVKVWPAVARFDRTAPGARYMRWVPLVLAPGWAADHPDEPAPRPGPALLQELFENLTGQPAPGQPAVPFDPGP